MRKENTAEIDAPAEVVWRLTMDVEDWPSYVPTMSKIERLDSGPLRVGSRARIRQPGQSPAVWTVTRLDPGREFAWQTRRLGMTMTGTHALEATGDRSCRNTLGIEISGGPAPVLGPLLARILSRAMAIENKAVKAKAEAPDAV
jgi:hypothetical protein